MDQQWCCCTSTCMLLPFDLRPPGLILSQFKDNFESVCTSVSRKRLVLRSFAPGLLMGADSDPHDCQLPGAFPPLPRGYYHSSEIWISGTCRVSSMSELTLIDCNV